MGDSFRAGKPQLWSPRSFRVLNTGYGYVTNSLKAPAAEPGRAGYAFAILFMSLSAIGFGVATGSIVRETFCGSGGASGWEFARGDVLVVAGSLSGRTGTVVEPILRPA